MVPPGSGRLTSSPPGGPCSCVWQRAVGRQRGALRRYGGPGSRSRARQVAAPRSCRAARARPSRARSCRWLCRFCVFQLKRSPSVRNNVPSPDRQPGARRCGSRNAGGWRSWGAAKMTCGSSAGRPGTAAPAPARAVLTWSAPLPGSEKAKYSLRLLVKSLSSATSGSPALAAAAMAGSPVIAPAAPSGVATQPAGVH